MLLTRNIVWRRRPLICTLIKDFLGSSANLGIIQTYHIHLSLSYPYIDKKMEIIGKSISYTYITFTSVNIFYTVQNSKDKNVMITSSDPGG